MNEEYLMNSIKEIRLKKGEIDDALFCLKQVRGILDCSMEDKDVHAKRIIDAFLKERENESR